jgi:hypothetical protein
MRYARLVIKRSLLLGVAVCLLACASDETGAGGSQGSPASSSSAGGAGGTSSVTSSSTDMTSSSSGPCTMGSGAGCPCPGGTCPETLTEGIAAASHLADNGTDLFYIASIDRLSKNGGSPAQLVTGSVAAFTLDDTSLYWIDGSGTSVSKAALDGTGKMALGNADGFQHPQFVAVDEANLYYATMSTMGTTTCAGVKRLPTGGGAAVKVSETCVAGETLTPYGLGVDATNIYWITVITPGFTNGTIWKADKTGQDTMATLLATVNGAASDLVVDPTGIYWLAGSVFRVDPGGGEPVKVSAGLDVAAYAVDGTTVYVLGDGLASVESAVTTTQLAYETGTDLVVDATDIYWLSGSSGAVSVLKLGK